MSATQTKPTEHTQLDNTPPNSTDADIVQTLSPGDIITVHKLTRRQHQLYLDNPDNTLMDVACEKLDYLVLNTPDPDDTRSVFAAKIIRLDNYSEYTSTDTIPSPYTPNNDNEKKPEIWNITTPYVPYNNEGTGALISRLSKGESIITHIIRDINITDHTEL